MRLSSTLSNASWKSPAPGKLFQWMIVVTVKIFFLIQRWNLLWCNFYWNTVMMCPPKPSFLQGEETWLLQSSLVVQILQPLDHLRGPPLDPLQSVCCFLELWGWELSTALQVRPDKWSGMIRSVSLPVTALQMQSGIQCALAAAATHCQLLFSLCPPAAPGVSQQGCSPATLH